MVRSSTSMRGDATRFPLGADAENDRGKAK
jgi:hypothetical protein